MPRRDWVQPRRKKLNPRAALAQLFDAQVFEAVDGSNVEFRVFLASLSDPSVWLTDTAAILKAADGK